MCTHLRIWQLATSLLLITASLGMGKCENDPVITTTPTTPTTPGGEGGGSSTESLTALALSSGTLNPAFSTGTTSYNTMVVNTNSLTVTPTATGGTLTVNGVAVASGAASGAISLTPGNNTVTVVLTDGGGPQTHTLTVRHLAQEAYIKASNPEANDNFTFVALDGDTLVVGASGEDSSATGVGDNQADNSAPSSGAVYVFTRAAGVWTQQAYLKASNPESNDLFGGSIALSGDTLAVGARNEDSNASGINGDQTNNSASGSGAVYICLCL